MKETPSIRTKIPVKGRTPYMIKRDILAYFSKEPDVLKVADIVRLLRCSKNTVYALINQGKLESVRVGRSIFIPKACLVEFLTYEKNFQIIRKEPSYFSRTFKGSSDIIQNSKQKRAE